MKVCGPLGGHKQGNTGTASKSGHGTSRSSSRGKGGGRSWRGVVEVAVEMRLINEAYLRLLIYLRRLEEWQIICLPVSWALELRAYGRDEVLAGMQEGVLNHVIAGKMCRSHLVYKVKTLAMLVC